MEQPVVISIADEAALPIVEQLAYAIWPAAYGEILSGKQIDYMLNLFYSIPALRNQLNQQGHRFAIARLNDRPVGYASWSHTSDPGIFKLHKLYVLPTIQGKGIGKKLVQYVIGELPAEAIALRLNVNRHNKARLFYQQLGFEMIGEEDIDIGNGYFMNDYVMERELTE